jgi:hypothetical protein
MSTPFTRTRSGWELPFNDKLFNPPPVNFANVPSALFPTTDTPLGGIQSAGSVKSDSTNTMSPSEAVGEDNPTKVLNVVASLTWYSAIVDPSR